MRRAAGCPVRGQTRIPAHPGAVRHPRARMGDGASRARTDRARHVLRRRVFCAAVQPRWGGTRPARRGVRAHASARAGALFAAAGRVFALEGERARRRPQRQLRCGLGAGNAQRVRARARKLCGDAPLFRTRNAGAARPDAASAPRRDGQFSYQGAGDLLGIRPVRRGGWPAPPSATAWAANRYCTASMPGWRRELWLLPLQAGGWWRRPMQR